MFRSQTSVLQLVTMLSHVARIRMQRIEMTARYRFRRSMALIAVYGEWRLRQLDRGEGKE